MSRYKDIGFLFLFFGFLSFFGMREPTGEITEALYEMALYVPFIMILIGCTIFVTIYVYAEPKKTKKVKK